MKRIFQFLKSTRKRTLVLLVSTVTVLSIAIGTTVAFIITKTDTYDNTFVPPIAKIHLEGYDDITNVGNIPVYVRSLAIVNWLSTDDEHTISSETPKVGVDFEVDFVTEGWFLASDGFYYYTKQLNPGESVVLLTEAVQLKEKAGYELRLQLLSSSIQANPVDAINYAWPAVQVNENGELEPATTP